MSHSFSLLLEALKTKVRLQSRSAAGPPPTEVDVVYLWKDDSDASWLAKKRAFVASQQTGVRTLPGQAAGGVLPQLDELKFSLRSLETNFHALRNVYLVTDGQVPGWLDLGHPKLRLIDVADLVEKRYLPTYNSQAIESYFYTLDELSEQFVYFNDDFFLLRGLDGGAFFPGADSIKVRLGRALSARGQVKVGEDADTSAHKNANRLLDRYFRSDYRLTVMHRPYALTKTLYTTLAEGLPEAFSATRSSQLRSANMVAIHSMLLPYWAYYTGRAELVPPRLRRKDMFYLSNDKKKNGALFKRIRASDDIGFCVQGSSEPLSDKVVSAFKAEMTTLYPEASSFEK